jgi:TRAP-type C4-dicarboxylate transport system substrate-binding protein
MYNISNGFVAAVISVIFSLNAMAADIVAPANNPIATSPGAKPEQRLRNQQEWDNMTSEQRKEIREHWNNMSPEERKQVRNKLNEQWKNMSPEEREARRKEMHDNFKNMSPEERRQFQLDMGKTNDMIPPVNNLPGDANGTSYPSK